MNSSPFTLTLVVGRYHAWLLRKHDPKTGKFVPHTLRKAEGEAPTTEEAKEAKEKAAKEKKDNEPATI